MKKALFVISFVLFATFGFAQQAINQTLIDYFDNLSKTQVPTGILIEQGFPMYNLEEYKGQVLTDSNKVDADLFGWLYMGLAGGNVNDNTVIPDPQVYANMYQNTYTGGANLPIAILNYRYNYIKTDALSQNLVYLSNGKMYDTPNRASSPYGESTLFIAAPMMPSSSRANVTFSIPSNLYLSNQTSALQSIQVDLGDGAGYQTVGLGQTINAYYGSDGQKELKVRCTLVNGQVFDSHSVLQVNDKNRVVATLRSPPTSYNTDMPDLTETNVTGCKLNYFFHCPQQGLQKPFIFIEGFDPAGTNTFKDMIERLANDVNLSPRNQPSMLQRLYDEGYDLIYVDFTNGAGDIPSNAQVVKNVIRRVNTLKTQNGSTIKTRVLGASMGGIVGKWAIREMEIAGENHDIDKYIAFDSPLRGANVPMGIQFMIKDLDTREARVKMRINAGPINVIFTIKTIKIGEFVPGVKDIKGLLTAPAAKQMLFYSAFTPSGNPREFHDDFYARLAALGDLQVDYSVVSNGSSINQPQLLNAGELYAAITGIGSTSARIFNGPNSPSIDVRVALDFRPFAIPANGSGSVYRGSILIKLPVSSNIPLPIGLTIDVGSQIFSNVSNLKPLDSAPGGFTNFGFPNQAANLSFGHVIIRGDFGTKTKGLWCFVPTFSALDIAEPTNVNQNFDCTATNTNADRCVGSIDASAFSGDIGAINTIGGTAHNQDHVSINQRNATFLLNQLAGGAGLNNLAGSLTRTYNFGVSDQTPSQTVFQPISTPNIISRGLTVEGTGKLWVNRSGKINFTDENNLLNQSNGTFNLSIRRGTAACVVGNTSVIIQNNGVMQLGDPSVNNTSVTHIETGATLDIRSNGILQIENGSQLVIENGGKLIINAGATVNLTGTNSRIIVQNGGELIINGQFNGVNGLIGDGHIRFEQGNIFTLNVRNTTIRSSYGGGTAIKGSDLGHFWFRENCLIDNFETGIDLTYGLNWNLIMTDGSTIQQCFTGINLNSSVYNSSVDLGILHMDCARMIQNGTAIRGRDIIFSAYARDPNFNTFTKNSFIPNGHYIESVFEHRVESDLWFHGNFWDNTTPSSTPVNASWSFLTQSLPQAQIPWNGTFHTNNTREDPNNPNNVSANTNCGGIELRGEKEDPLSKHTIVKVNGVYRDVKVQYDAGFKKLKEKQLKKALDLLVAVAEIPRNVRDTASPVVKHFVDIARAMTLKIGVGTRSSNDG